MTIASEISRLQTAKANIEASIESKWVDVPWSASLSDYPSYIDQISSWSWYDLFVPSSLVVENVIQNSIHSVYVTNQIFDTLSPNGDTYYSYFWYENDNSTAYPTYRIWATRKQAKQNMTFYQNLTSVDERNVHYLTKIESKRMKKENNNVILSVLYTLEYDSSWQTTSGRSMTYYCCNITNTTGQTVNLGTINADSGWGYSDADVQRMYTAWETSCWMTSSETIASLWLTTTTLYRPSSSNWYNLQATIN